MPEISVVIPALNCRKQLELCLAALARSERRPDEVIVVDDCSSDGTGDAAREWGATVLRTSRTSGPAVARNLGAFAARGGVLFFLDADVCIHADAIARAEAALDADTSICAVMGMYDDTPAAPGMVSRYRNLLHHWVHLTGNRKASTFWAGCGAMRRDAFEAMGGFAASYTRPCIEDVELGTRLKSAGHGLALDPSIQGTHLKRWTLRTMLQTDLFWRAIPWVELILERGSPPDDLNLRWKERASVALAWFAAASLIAAVWSPLFAACAVLCLLAHAWLNWPLLSYLAGRRGLWFALGAWPLHMLYHLNCGLGLCMGILAHLFRKTERAGQAANRGAGRT